MIICWFVFITKKVIKLTWIIVSHQKLVYTCMVTGIRDGIEPDYFSSLQDFKL